MMKRAGLWLLTLLVGIAFATGVAFAEDESAQDILSAYAAHGLSMDEGTGSLVFRGQTVRMLETKDGVYAHADGGEVDVYVIFTEQKDGMEIDGLGAYDAAHFVERTSIWAWAREDAEPEGDVYVFMEHPVVDYAAAALERYLRKWRAGDYEAMVEASLPSWVAEQTAPQQQLYWNHNWWELMYWDYCCVESSGPEVYITITATVAKNNMERKRTSMEYYARIVQEKGSWFVDPESMRSGVVTTPVVVTPDVDFAFYDDYAPFGLVYEKADGLLYYEGELVRIFTDVIESNCMAPDSPLFTGTVRRYAHPQLEGTVDVHALRSGHVLVGIGHATQSEFDVRTDTLMDALAEAD